MSEKKFKTRSNKKKERMKSVRNWIIFTAIYVVFMGFLYGSATVYYPTPIQIGFLYLDISMMIIIFGISIWSVISFILLKKEVRV